MGRRSRLDDIDTVDNPSKILGILYDVARENSRADAMRDYHPRADEHKRWDPTAEFPRLHSRAHLTDVCY